MTRPMCSLVRSLSLGVAVWGALAAPAASAYRFICGDIDFAADGESFEESNDGCGVCDEQNAARWRPSALEFAIDRDRRPSEVSANEWESAIETSLANWSGIPGHTLVLSDTGDSDLLCFNCDENGNASSGTDGDNGVNEIFWVTTNAQWIAQLGDDDGIDGILGITLTSGYICDEPRGPFADADIIMNGVGWDWDFNSIEATLTHEVGHAFGLGHPCGDCSTSIMAAVSGFDAPVVPLADDWAGIQALYPGESGGLGTPCTSGDQCDEGLSCVTTETGNRYCTTSCTTTCTSGFVCTNVSGTGDRCLFPGDDVAAVGESCAAAECDAACEVSVQAGCNVCLIVGDEERTCFAGCDISTGDGCADDSECQELQNGGGVCVLLTGGTRQRGQTCDVDNPCVDDVVCATDPGAPEGICTGVCDAASGTGCLQTESCFAMFTDGSGACVAVGSGREGAACEFFEDCARGYVCLQDAVGSFCYARCDQSFGCSDERQTCFPIEDLGDLAVCDPLVELLPDPEGDSEGDAPGEGEDEGGEEGQGSEGGPSEGDDVVDAECNVERGNFDCPAGSGCRAGECVAGLEGSVASFGLCSEDGECEGALCRGGVCTRPCDTGGGCPEGYSCDEGAVAGGLCMPEACTGDDSCGEGLRCVESGAAKVCAVDEGLVCGCNATGSSTPPWASVALLALTGRWMSKRRLRGQRGA